MKEKKNRGKMREFIFIFIFLLASCENPCNCESLSIDPFNSSPLPSGCGCSVEKMYVPDIGVDIAEEVTGTKTTDIYAAHKLKN
jgi:hypothetical protein